MNVTWLKMFFCLIFLCSLICVIPFAVGADELSASLPDRVVGDSWSFAIDYKDMGLKGDMTCTVTNVSLENPSGGYRCIEFTSIAAGQVYGQGRLGTWLMNLKEYYSDSASQLVEAQLTRNVTTEFVNGSILTTVTEINSVYNPAYGFNDGFPLVVSKTWTPYSTVTSTISTIINGETTQENYTSTATLNMVVDRIENLTTPAGTFETYVLVGTGSDGSKIETYYAPEVAMQIKEVDYSPTQEITFTMDLQSYQLTQPHTVLPVYWIIIAAAISSITICAIIVIILKHQNVKTNKTV